MAISDDLPGVKVDITVNNIPLKEYENGGDEEERATTKYVESTTGQEFAISIELLPAFEFKGDCIGFRIEADGELLSKPAIARNSLRQYCVIKGLLIDDDQVEKFKFSDIDISEVPSPTVRKQNLLTSDQIAMALTLKRIHRS